MPAPVDAFVFDLDGTLVDTMVAVPQAYVDTVRLLGGPTVDVETVLAAWPLGPTPVVLAHLVGRPVGERELDVFFGEIDRAASRAEAFPGVIEVLDALAEMAIPVAVLTNATTRGAAQLLRGTGLDRRFATVVGADLAPRIKPHPDGLRQVCALLGVEEARTAFVGDAQTDIDAAIAAGSIAVHAAWGSRGELARVDVRVDHPSQLLDLI